ncbi:lipase member H-A-like [Chironomus tepperi]|uniref:lipase member H-A-like n=1 Tax=Chironomus tepperi TaxID=113505 RepID=UPI00391F5EA9
MGWIEDFDSESTETISRAYIRRGDHNIGEYYTVIPRFTAIAKILASILHEWINNGLDINKVHCVGHSFGSHIMGIMARELYKLSMGKYKIKRISGLDPAHYGFFPFPSHENPLSSNDAEFVDAIHTDVNFIGTNYRVGHVDFYPNNGNLQPGCPQFKFKNYMQLVNSKRSLDEFLIVLK